MERLNKKGALSRARDFPKRNPISLVRKRKSFSVDSPQAVSFIGAPNTCASSRNQDSYSSHLRLISNNLFTLNNIEPYDLLVRTNSKEGNPVFSFPPPHFSKLLQNSPSLRTPPVQVLESLDQLKLKRQVYAKKKE